MVRKRAPVEALLMLPAMGVMLGIGMAISTYVSDDTMRRGKQVIVEHPLAVVLLLLCVGSCVHICYVWLKEQCKEWDKQCKEEWDNHMRTHIPFRRWCPFCVKGKCKSGVHQKTKKSDEELEREVPVI